MPPYSPDSRHAAIAPGVRISGAGRSTTLATVIWVLATAAQLKASQRSASDPWPAITQEEMALKDDPSNPGAKALILDKEVVTDDTKSIESYYYRIKILTDSGKKYADIEIPYVDKMVRVEEIRARTVQPDGKSMDFTGQVFDKVVLKARKVRVQVKTFTLPDVQKGSIIEYSYTLHGREKMPDWLRHSSEYLIKVPMSIPTARWIISEEMATRHARFLIRPVPGGLLRTNSRGIGKEDEVRAQPDGSMVLELNNIAPFREEEFMPPENVLKSRVDLFYSLGPATGANFFWSEKGKLWAESSEKFIGHYKEVQRAVEEIVSAGDTPELKLRKLYGRAQQVRAVSYEHMRSEKEEKAEGLKQNQNVADVLKRGYAYGNEINLLFVALARAAGFESYPVKVASRDRWFFDAQLFDPGQVNALVVWVGIGAKNYYLDPATLYCPFGLLPWAETNTFGISVRKEGGAQVATPVPISADAVIERKAALRLDREGNLQGNLDVTFAGQEALERRLDYRERDEAGRRKALEEEVQSWLPKGSTAELKSMDRWEQASSMLSAGFSVKIRDLGTVAGRRLLLPVGVFQVNKAHAFQSATRVHAVYFSYPYQVIDDLTVELADGQKVETLPPPRTQGVSYGRYEMSCENQAGVLKSHRKVVMDGIFFKAEYYPAVKSFFSYVRDGDDQQIVLQNAPAAGSPAQH